MANWCHRSMAFTLSLLETIKSQFPFLNQVKEWERADYRKETCPKPAALLLAFIAKIKKTRQQYARYTKMGAATMAALTEFWTYEAAVYQVTPQVYVTQHHLWWQTVVLQSPKAETGLLHHLWPELWVPKLELRTFHMQSHDLSLSHGSSLSPGCTGFVYLMLTMALGILLGSWSSQFWEHTLTFEILTPWNVLKGGGYQLPLVTGFFHVLIFGMCDLIASSPPHPSAAFSTSVLLLLVVHLTLH